MWTRKSVKQKGKKAFFGNFWKCVLVAIILGIALGAAGSASSGGSGGFSAIPAITNSFTDDNHSGSTTVTISDDDGNSHTVDLTDPANLNPSSIDQQDVNALIAAFIAVFLAVFIISLIISVFALAFRYLLLTPFEYGCRKFFRKNLDEPAKLSNIVYAFDSNYKNIVKTAFLRDLFIWLWSLLFLIPGIIKSYQWRLVPYIMSEDPAMNYKDALAESTKLMQGNKWKTFVLDLSFIGWDILSLLTWGFLDLFFVAPYKASTDAALYETLKYGIDAK